MGIEVERPAEAKVLKAARAVLVKKEKIEEDVAAKRALISKHEENITFQKDLLKNVPKTGGKSKAVDKILTEIMQAKKQITAIEDESEDLKEKIADLLEQAGAELETLQAPE